MQIQLPFYVHGRDPAFVLAQKVGSPEPDHQGKPGAMHNRPRGNRFLADAMPAHEDPVSLSQLIGFGAATFLALVAGWPSLAGQILNARLLCVETMLEPDKG